ncbi:MAG: hypothetical protein ACT4R6_01820, partial [Gemmatimonadaceae bacterium]
MTRIQPEVAPPELAVRMAHLVDAEHPGRIAAVSGSELLGAAEKGLAQLVERGDFAAREHALELLAIDALVTLAFERAGEADVLDELAG